VTLAPILYIITQSELKRWYSGLPLKITTDIDTRLFTVRIIWRMFNVNPYPANMENMVSS